MELGVESLAVFCHEIGQVRCNLHPCGATSNHNEIEQCIFVLLRHARQGRLLEEVRDAGAHVASIDQFLEVKGVLLHARDVEIVGLRPNGVNQDVVGHLKDIFVINLFVGETVVLSIGTHFGAPSAAAADHLLLHINAFTSRFQEISLANSQLTNRRYDRSFLYRTHGAGWQQRRVQEEISLGNDGDVIKLRLLLGEALQEGCGCPTRSQHQDFGSARSVRQGRVDWMLRSFRLRCRAKEPSIAVADWWRNVDCPSAHQSFCSTQWCSADGGTSTKRSGCKLLCLSSTMSCLSWLRMRVLH
mmetsp:Transcript_46153/g.73351  ORF Transcript_46153/g.73351 Transcript_46153/m.73351 type:complete len:301 (+) Transcript_46153:1307-2209(+)